MKIAFLTNNENVLPLANWIENVEGRESLIIYDKKITVEWLELNKIDFILSYNYHFIIKPDVLEACCYNAVNLHISLLPWNRGNDPNIWSFIENTPKGVTIHRIDSGIDTGNILLQKEVVFDECIESFFSSYNKLHHEICELLKNNWKDLRQNTIPDKPQCGGIGSYHYEKELDPYRKMINFNEPINKALRDLKSLIYTL